MNKMAEKEKDFFSIITETVKGMGIDTDKILYGFLCSEATAGLIKKQFEQHIKQKLQALTSIFGLEILVIEHFSDSHIWVMEKETFMEVKKNGLSTLIRKIAKANNIKLWGLNDY